MTCDRPGCTGTIEADGYCNVCGHKSNRRRGPAVTSAAGIGTAGGVVGGGVAGGGVAAPAAPAASNGVGGAGPAAPTAPGLTAAGPPTTRSTTTGTAGGTASTTAGRGLGGGRSNGRPSSRGNLGAGLVEVPPVGYRDPASVLMVDPHVSESKRHCASCDGPVGRSRDGRPGRADGFCPQCGAPYSFTPKLAAATWSPVSTRSPGAWPMGASGGSIWPGTATSTTGGWSSRACSTPGTSRRWPRPSPSDAFSPKSSTPTL